MSGLSDGKIRLYDSSPPICRHTHSVSVFREAQGQFNYYVLQFHDIYRVVLHIIVWRRIHTEGLQFLVFQKSHLGQRTHIG